MGLPYLKIQPEEAIRLIDHCIVTGYQVKDEINNEYFNDKTNVTDEKISRWDAKSNSWANDTLKILATIFVSLKESYNFRDAPTSALMRNGTNIKWNGIINQIEARISRLNQYDTDIRTNFNIKVEIVGRDKIVQSGTDGQIEINN